MNKSLFLICLFLILACSESKNKWNTYRQAIGFDPDKPTVLVSLDNCSYCFGEFQEAIQLLDQAHYTIVIISSQNKKAALFMDTSQPSVFMDDSLLAFKLGLIKSLPVILLPGGELIEIFSPNQLSAYAK